jgi:prevent-host-death family protein
MALRADIHEMGVAEVKAAFSELIERVGRGERFLVRRRGRPVMALVPPDQATSPSVVPAGLATIAGALEDWPDLPAVVEEIYQARRLSQDRDVPELD